MRGITVVTALVLLAGGAAAPATASAAAPGPSFVAATGAQSGGKAPKVTVPAAVRVGQLMLLDVSWNDTKATASVPAGWTRISTAEVGGLASVVWWKVATAADVGSAVRVNLSVATKSTLELLAYAGVDPTRPIEAFGLSSDNSVNDARGTPLNTLADGDYAVSLWSVKSSSVTSWRPPGQATVRHQDIGTGSGYIATLTADSGAPVPAGLYGTLVAYTDVPTNRTTSWTIGLRPA